MQSDSSNNDLKQNLAFHWAYYSLKTLLPSTCKMAVISPGSRSTPLTMAASALCGLHTHVLLDERSAAFTALGMAKSSGKPALLICTSGTAAANYYPAVIEAYQSAVPMIMLSADRPPRLHHSGANQTINQQNLFGTFADFFDAGLPNLAPEQLSEHRRALNKLARKTVRSRNPLQINFPFDKPLESTIDVYEKARKSSENAELISNGYDDAILAEEIKEFSRLPKEVKRQLVSAKRPVVIAGQHQPFDPLLLSTTEIAGKLNAPILAESASQWFGAVFPQRFIHGSDAFLRSEEIQSRFKPDLIIRVGDAIVGKGIAQYLKYHRSVYQVHFSTTGKPADFTNSLDSSIPVDAYRFEWPEVVEKSERGWLERWQLLSELFKEKRCDILDSTTAFTDLHVMQQIISILDREHSIFVGNSLPVRDLELVADAVKLHQPIHTNRGASGIDGNISTAAGVALQSEKPVISITGDLTFLHDINGLMAAKKVEAPFLIVVVNNGGGTIFDMLPVSRHTSLMERYFRTPQDADIMHLAKSCQIPFLRVTSIAELNNAIANELGINGPLILECVTDAKHSMQARKQLWNHPWHENIHT